MNGPYIDFNSSFAKNFFQEHMTSFLGRVLKCQKMLGPFYGYDNDLKAESYFWRLLWNFKKFKKFYRGDIRAFYSHFWLGHIFQGDHFFLKKGPFISRILHIFLRLKRNWTIQGSQRIFKVCNTTSPCFFLWNPVSPNKWKRREIRNTEMLILNIKKNCGGDSRGPSLLTTWIFVKICWDL